MSLRQDFWHRGFATIEAVVDKLEVERVLAALNSATLHRSRAGARHVLSNPGVAALAENSRLLSIATEIFGCAAIPFRATLFDKSPRANWLVGWHQDTALPFRERHDFPGWGPWSVKDGVSYAHAPATALSQIVALRVHLDDSTSQNGPLRVLPGTHNSGVLSDEEVHNLAAEISPVDCSVSTGGVLAMSPLIIHASSKSQAQMKRRVLHIEYAGSLHFANRLELAIA